MLGNTANRSKPEKERSSPNRARFVDMLPNYRRLINTMLTSGVCMGVVLFSTGLILGFLLHLPGDSPSGHTGSGDNIVASDLTRNRRELLPWQRTLINNETWQTVDVEIDLSNRDDAVGTGSQPSSIHIARDNILHRENEQIPFPLTASQNSNNKQRLAGSLPVTGDDSRASVKPRTGLLTVTNSRLLDKVPLDRSASVVRSVNVVVGGRPNVARHDQQGIDNRKTNDDEGVLLTPGHPTPFLSVNENPRNAKYLEDGIFWNDHAEAMTPIGFGEDDLAKWRKLVDESQVLAMSAGCGRMQNRELLLTDGLRACARYRLNTDQVQGEIYSYYLARVLGIRQVLPSILLVPNPREELWRRVQRSLADAQWSPEKVIIATPFLENLEPEPIPLELRQQSRQLHPSEEVISGWSSDRIRTLVQWSDLIVFDYLTANLDRVVNNMYNQQWNPEMMNSSTHNLERRSDSGLLIFLDNESGLFHSYRLLDKYDKYHQSLLRSLCVFRRSTADRIRSFIDKGDIGSAIMSRFQNDEPLHKHIHRIPDKTLAILNRRLRDVNQQISWCQARYGR